MITRTFKYYPLGECLNSPENCPTDKLFTGQRLDDTGLYYYNARYYDPTIGRFISADTVVPNSANPQSLNRYSYCLNNPLKYTDPSGQAVYIGGYDTLFLWGVWDLYGTVEVLGLSFDDVQLWYAWLDAMEADFGLTMGVMLSPYFAVSLRFGNLAPPLHPSVFINDVHSAEASGNFVNWSFTLDKRYLSDMREGLTYELLSISKEVAYPFVVMSKGYWSDQTVAGDIISILAGLWEPTRPMSYVMNLDSFVRTCVAYGWGNATRDELDSSFVRCMGSTFGGPLSIIFDIWQLTVDLGQDSDYRPGEPMY